MECLQEGQHQTDTAAREQEEADLVVIDEGHKTIRMHQGPITLARHPRRGEDGDLARTRDHHQGNRLEDEVQPLEVHPEGDAEVPVTVLEAAPVAVEVERGVNPEAEVDMGAGDEERCVLEFD
ncbi:uncharacterized protein A1O9_03969 [Exophiala aquamarina CBS 119918]|uniref:Uncharacterized protein n=1 Tax=Exophiala aquamarina CBS 119918 TaxID=1182545 RepID=A0A072PUA9_9EURO|nr:uncharacterized protein A1O9_03969 [Exophiala aquamarina CBS 119918]KEF59125.1 hypothetical protein A1O9_03969 [Exophiala aquamarina CBS 119918]